MAPILDPLLQALNSDYILPATQSIGNAAIIAVFAYLVPLLTMEINFFRLAVYKSWRLLEKQSKQSQDTNEGKEKTERINSTSSQLEMASANDIDMHCKEENNGDDSFASNDAQQVDSTNQQQVNNNQQDQENNKMRRVDSAVGHLLSDVSTALYEARDSITHNIHEARASITQNTSASPRNSHLSTTGAGRNSHISTASSVQVVQSLQQENQYNLDPKLAQSYKIIRQSSMEAIFISLLVYTLTAIAISLNTRGLDPKVIAIIIGASQFMTALMTFIISAKVPQWLGVYHAGKIRLVKCSSNYSQQFYHMALSTDANDSNDCTKKLRWNVRLGVSFHFAKFYIILMPFYCGVQRITIPLSIISGVIFGFILMWAVFVVHERYIPHRNIVSFTTILFVSILSAWTFTRGMAWIQAVWKLDLLKDEDVLMVISFFTWLGILAVVHALFIWHTLRTEESSSIHASGTAHDNSISSPRIRRAGSKDKNTSEDLSNRSGRENNKTPRRNSSYSSFVFDPRTHFGDGKSCQFTDHPDIVNALVDDQPALGLDLDGNNENEDDEYLDGVVTETPMVANANNSINNDGEFDEYGIKNKVVGSLTIDREEEVNGTSSNDPPPSPTSFQDNDLEAAQQPKKKDKRRCGIQCYRPACCEVWLCFSAEYRNSSCLWKFIVWVKIIVITVAYLLCLYFVAVSIGATNQIQSTKDKLPAVQEELYNNMHEGPVCAFDNKGPDSNITTFPDMEAAHEAGFLVLHCGACGACSNWQDLQTEWTTRNTMANDANECAKKSLFGGPDALTECLMEPNIGWGYKCAFCWTEDILCTKEHCVFIFLQSQLINQVTNFAVGPDDITSASCEEAHCEVGAFVPCSGATRRRMNITSSISRPGEQQCGIVDVESWDDLFFGSGVA